MVHAQVLSGAWGLILGGSSGMGLASAKKLAKHGMNLFVVHRDRRGATAKIEAEFDEIRAQGVRLISMNCDALSYESRQQLCAQIADQIGDGRIRVLLHSIALGNLRPVAPPPDQATKDRHTESLLNEEDFSQTIHNMGSSLLFWVQDLFQRRLFEEDARILGLTSEGNQLAWPGYAAIAAAKSTLESVARAIACEYGPHGIRCNILQPGITDTPALRMIPGHEQMKERALGRNPFGRLTSPEDIANAVFLMSLPEASWINGALLRVDGGEAISG